MYKFASSSPNGTNSKSTNQIALYQTKGVLREYRLDRKGGENYKKKKKKSQSQKQNVLIHHLIGKRIGYMGDRKGGIFGIENSKRQCANISGIEKYYISSFEAIEAIRHINFISPPILPMKS